MISLSPDDVKSVLMVIGKRILACAKHKEYVNIPAWHGV
jgi:hypothetical protein